VPVHLQMEAQNGPPLQAWSNASDVDWETATGDSSAEDDLDRDGVLSQLWVWLPAPTASLLQAQHEAWQAVRNQSASLQVYPTTGSMERLLPLRGDEELLTAMVLLAAEAATGNHGVVLPPDGWDGALETESDWRFVLPVGIRAIAAVDSDVLGGRIGSIDGTVTVTALARSE